MSQIDQDIRSYLQSLIRNIPDFPEEGIQFKDITPLLQDPDALQLAPLQLVKPFRDLKIDYVAGIESRGFMFGPHMASMLDAGFIAVRKPGKLPYDVVSSEYELEYGTDELQMHSDSIGKGDNVLIHDDLIATGGSSQAAADLVDKLNGNVVGYSFIMELSFLEGRKKIEKHGTVHSLFQY